MLSDYNVQNLATVHLKQRMRGGIIGEYAKPTLIIKRVTCA